MIVRDGRTKSSTSRIINSLSEKVQYLLPVLKPLFIQLLYSYIEQKKKYIYVGCQYGTS